jgi:hypothetical protein
MRYRDIVNKIQDALNGKKPAAAPQTHSYATCAALKVPSQMPSQPAAPKKNRKTDIVSKEWNKEVKNTSEYSVHLEANPHPAADLIPARVHRWNIKDYSSIAQKMQKLAKPPAEEMPEKISVITSSKEQNHKEGEKQNELWRDLMKNNVERHFRIDRITNFFS